VRKNPKFAAIVIATRGRIYSPGNYRGEISRIGAELA
jgi:hypothetical protein